MQLRPYQQEAVQAVYEHLRTRDDNPCVVIPTAGGKTPLLATICRDAVQRWGGRVLILAHVKELLEQAVEKLHAMAPDLWMQVGVYSAGLRKRDTEHSIIVAGIQSVYRRAAEMDRFDLILVDECFVAGTMVSTPSGQIPIEQVQPGMTVHNASGVGKVVATSTRPARDLVTLEYSDGTTITCTVNHPIFTEHGWQRAGKLELGSLAFSIEDMRMLRGRIPATVEATAEWPSQGAEGTSLAEAEILFPKMCQVAGKLHALRGCPEKGQRCAASDGASPDTPRWQRGTHAASAAASSGAGRWLGAGVGCDGSELPCPVTAETSEDRCGAPALDDRDRVGWQQPQLAEAPRGGRAQEHVLGGRRLVRVSRDEQASQRVVFNLHVSGHPSYFANGILVHNCHMIPPDGDGMYQTFLSESRVVNPHVRLVGLTATPYRMSTGTICGPDNLLNHVCYEVGVRELIVQGYLCPLKSKAGVRKVDMSGLHLRGGEFIAAEVEQLMDTDSLVFSACKEIVEQTQDRRSVLIFAAGVQHALHVQRVLGGMGHECGFVCGETLPFERTDTLQRFRDGQLKYLVNVNVLTTGFDAPNIDCVVLLRPTNSPGLYYQAVGRGFRLHPGKTDCLILDFGGNILRHGPVDALQVKDKRAGTGEAPAKECPQCHAVVHAAYSLCPECGYAFPEPERQKHDRHASDAGVLSGQVTDTRYEVQQVRYGVHYKRNAGPEHPPTMRVDYEVSFSDRRSEWVCFEHEGFARQKAEGWWRKRSKEPVPETVEQAVAICESGGIASTTAITVRSVAGEQYDRVIGHELGPIPEPEVFTAGGEQDDSPPPPDAWIDPADIPF